MPQRRRGWAPTESKVPRTHPPQNPLSYTPERAQLVQLLDQMERIP